MIVNSFLDWSKILNVSSALRPEINILAIIVFTYFCIDFILRILSTLITAKQQPARASIIDLSGQLLSLLIVIILVKTTQGSLIKLGIALCLSPIIILLVANLFYFNSSLKKYKPSSSKINFSYTKDLVKLGVIFFVIQLAGIIQYQTSNIIIARNLGTSDVTSYNVVFKFFSVLLMINTIFLSPFWSASTEAYVKNDIPWIKNAMKKYNQLNLILFLIGILMLIVSNNIYDLWLGKGKVNIPFVLSLFGCLYFNTMIFGSKYVHFLNGVNALKIQFWASVISPLIFALLAVLLVKIMHLGAASLFIAASIANFNGLVLAPVQYYQIVYKNKGGIWKK